MELGRAASTVHRSSASPPMDGGPCRRTYRQHGDTDRRGALFHSSSAGDLHEAVLVILHLLLIAAGKQQLSATALP